MSEARPQVLVLQLKWTEGGRERLELFGPWTQGDPETEDAALAHMMAAHRFIGEWRRVTGLDLADGGATAILVQDPEEWLRERIAGQVAAMTDAMWASGRTPLEPGAFDGLHDMLEGRPVPPGPAPEGTAPEPRDWPYRSF